MNSVLIVFIMSNVCGGAFCIYTTANEQLGINRHCINVY